MRETEVRPELEATLHARGELGEELEPQLVDRFADKLEEEIERRAADLAKRRQPAEHHSVTPLVLGSLGIGIPLIAIAGDKGGATGVIAVCIALVLMNVLWARFAMARR